MKVAYHFNCSGINCRYDELFYKIVFNELLGLNEQFISSKILTGDLLAHDLKVKLHDNEAFFNILLLQNSDNWNRIVIKRRKEFIDKDIFVICFETIIKEFAEKLHKKLLNTERYLGALEIDNSHHIHWILYGEFIGAKFRILNRKLSILIDNDELENLDYFEFTKSLFNGIAFEEIGKEYSNYRGSIFDDKHNYENAKREAEWKKSTESIFSSVTDEIIAKLTDPAPELIDKLWAINHTFLNATIGEQYAQAMTSCRRVFEYVTNCLFPATDKIIEGHSLKKDKYKNRLFQFATEQTRSRTSIEMIVINTESLFEEWDSLYELSNRGVHDEPHRDECRRCIIRTILLLDDLIALKQTPFDVNITYQKSLKNFTQSIIRSSAKE